MIQVDKITNLNYLLGVPCICSTLLSYRHNSLFEEVGRKPVLQSADKISKLTFWSDNIIYIVCFLQNALTWLQKTEMDSFWAGLIFEQLWSYILGAGSEYQHPPECTVFLCDGDGVPITPTWQSVTDKKVIAEEVPKTRFW